MVKLNTDEVTTYILDQHQRGAISEGYASRLLGVDGREVRDIVATHDPEWWAKRLAQERWGDGWEAEYKRLRKMIVG